MSSSALSFSHRDSNSWANDTSRLPVLTPACSTSTKGPRRIRTEGVVLPTYASSASRGWYERSSDVVNGPAATTMSISPSLSTIGVEGISGSAASTIFCTTKQ
eukprot:scaffold1104_cov299-Prasinococcus_capsulatus_cf.AAC.21